MKKHIAIIGTVLAAGFLFNVVGLAACTPESPEEYVPEITERVRYSEKTNPYAELTWEQIPNIENWAEKSKTAPIYYQFEGNYAEGWQGNYDRDYLFMDCYEDGSLYGTCQSQTYIGWWYNVTDAGQEGLTLNILTQNGQEYNSGGYGVSLQQLGSDGYYEFSGNIVGSQNGRLMPINGFHYSPIKNITVDTSGAKTKYVEGDSFSSTGLSISIERENGKTAMVDAQSYEDRVRNKRISFTGFDSDSAGKKTVTVHYLNEAATKSFDVDVYKVTAIEAVLGDKAKKNYHVGQEFSDADIKIMATVEGTSDKIELSQGYSFGGYDPQATGEQTVTVTYGEGESALTTQFKITSYAMKDNGLSLNSEFAKTEYHLGDPLDTENLMIEATYTDDQTDTVLASDCKITGYEPNKSGDQTVTVEFGGQQKTYQVHVYGVTSFTVNTDSAKKEYFVGDDFDSTGIVVSATFEDNETEEIALNRVKFDGFTSDAADDSVEITADFAGKTQTFTVKVTAPVYTGTGKYGGTKGEVKIKITTPEECEVTFNGKTATVGYSIMNVGGRTIYGLSSSTTPSGLTEDEWKGLHKQYEFDRESMSLSMILVYEIPDNGYAAGTSRFEYEPFKPEIGGYCEQRYLFIDEDAQTVTLTYKYWNAGSSDTWVMKYTLDPETNKMTFTEVIDSQIGGSGKSFAEMRKEWILHDDFTATPADVDPSTVDQ